MIIAFDFDGTLTRHDVQELAKKMVDDGHNVWCVTGRTGQTWRGQNNDDLHEICEMVGIKPHKRIFCGKVYWEAGRKADFFLDMSRLNVIFDIHLDNHPDEVQTVKELDLGINVINVEDKNWEIQWQLATQR